MPKRPKPKAPPAAPIASIFALGRGVEQSAVSFLPGVRVELLSNKQAIVDGCRGIIEYSDTLIRLSSEKLILGFTGVGLEIKLLSQETMIIEGTIHTVEYR